MESSEQNRPKVGVGVYVLNDEGQVLMMLRSGNHAPGFWCPPGGHLEMYESFEQCAIREAKEEVGLEVINPQLVGVTNDFIEESKHYVTVHLRAEGFTGEPKNMEPDKHTKLGWFNLNKLPKPLMLPAINFFATNPLCLCGSGKKYKECHGK